MSRATEEQVAWIVDLLSAMESRVGKNLSRQLNRAEKAKEAALIAALRALLAERTELLKDRERIDWLESDMPTTLMRYSISDIGEVVQVGSCPATRRTLRDAIDAAMPKSEEKPCPKTSPK